MSNSRHAAFLWPESCPQDRLEHHDHCKGACHRLGCPAGGKQVPVSTRCKDSRRAACLGLMQQTDEGTNRAQGARTADSCNVLAEGLLR